MAVTIENNAHGYRPNINEQQETQRSASIHLDRGYDSGATRERLRERGLSAEIYRKGEPAPLGATKRGVVERTSSWHNAHKKLMWCTERRGRVVDFWVAF